MSAVSLMNLRQDAGFLATTAGGAPFVMSRPWVLPDLPLVFKSLHETVDEIVLAAHHGAAMAPVTACFAVAESRSHGRGVL